MRQEQMKTQIAEQHRELVKFNGEFPLPGEMKEPFEIVTSIDGEPAKVTYRQGEGETIKYFTGDGANHAVLAKEEPRK